MLHTAFSLVRAVEALTPKMLSHFWGTHRTQGFDSHFLCAFLLNKKTAFYTHDSFLVRAVEALTLKMQAFSGNPCLTQVGSTPTIYAHFF